MLPGMSTKKAVDLMRKVHRNDPTKQPKPEGLGVPTTIMTRAGTYFDLAAPTPDMVSVYDIAWALSMTCRYGGHCTEFYSVAQHSVLVADVAPDDLKMAALFHDAAEAYVGDVVKPLKDLVPEFKPIEQRIMGAICSHFGIPYEDTKHPKIKEIDMRMLRTEQLHITPVPDHVWPGFENSHPYGDVDVKPWSQETAFRRFLEAYGRYGQPGVME